MRHRILRFALGARSSEELSWIWAEESRGTWEQSGRMTLYLDEAADPSLLRDRLAGAGIADVTESVEEEVDWVARYQATIRPFPIGARFLIVPDGRAVESGGRIPILLEPGQAFGTGEHPSTAYCLEALERAVTPGCAMLDVGTGSGILAIGALKLGAAAAVGVDLDGPSLTVARENALKNAVPAFFAEGSVDAAPVGPWDVIAANILAEPLVELMPALATALAPGGTLILAGILRELAPSVRAAATGKGLRETDCACTAQWTGFTFVK